MDTKHIVLKAFSIMILAGIVVVSILFFSHKQGEDALKRTGNPQFCGTLEMITNSPLKSGSSIPYYLLRNTDNRDKNFTLHHSVSAHERQLLVLNKKLCFTYFIDFLQQSSVIHISGQP